VLTRERSNRKRAKEYYKVDIDDYSIADLVITTEKLDVNGVKKVVKTFIDEFKRLNPEIF